jgi:hypothetical protein
MATNAARPIDFIKEPRHQAFSPTTASQWEDGEAKLSTLTGLAAPANDSQAVELTGENAEKYS